ncbi:unnamed protein product [Prorocentrum cordatum]|uniref:Uncharacterized protein n=1 Tax=Prorocentrum cordatum TaxID=2364126 RepID=A0ABN9P601_9DINO|nr:unnamed protein product [Polarella glacialis]
MAEGSDAAGLFLGTHPRAAAGGADSKKRRFEPPAAEEEEGREKLRRADHAYFALLDHEGESVIDAVPLDKLWEAAAQEGQWAKTHTNLARVSEYCVGVGVSQTSQVLAVAIRKLQSDSNVRAVLLKETHTKATAEATALLHHLDLLHRRKGSEEPYGGEAKGVSFAKLKAPVPPRSAPAGALARAAAAAPPPARQPLRSPRRWWRPPRRCTRGCGDPGPRCAASRASSQAGARIGRRTPPRRLPGLGSTTIPSTRRLSGTRPRSPRRRRLGRLRRGAGRGRHPRPLRVNVAAWRWAGCVAIAAAFGARGALAGHRAAGKTWMGRGHTGIARQGRGVRIWILRSRLGSIAWGGEKKDSRGRPLLSCPAQARQRGAKLSRHPRHSPGPNAPRALGRFGVAPGKRRGLCVHCASLARGRVLLLGFSDAALLRSPKRARRWWATASRHLRALSGPSSLWISAVRARGDRARRLCANPDAFPAHLPAAVRRGGESARLTAGGPALSSASLARGRAPWRISRATRLHVKHVV